MWYSTHWSRADDWVYNAQAVKKKQRTHSGFLPLALMFGLVLFTYMTSQIMMETIIGYHNNDHVIDPDLHVMDDLRLKTDI
ncbi:hypothetical protein N7513_010228 [Penicillium frequentans]|nr:hypothetical protein N7513_010228 [Penicillium glabrum]